MVGWIRRSRNTLWGRYCEIRGTLLEGMAGTAGLEPAASAVFATGGDPHVREVGCSLRSQVTRAKKLMRIRIRFAGVTVNAESVRGTSRLCSQPEPFLRARSQTNAFARRRTHTEISCDNQDKRT